MPSVGMRRSTRVFGARVLRSGRRLWTEPNEYVRTAHGENKFPELIDNSADGGGDAGGRLKDMRHENENCASVDMTAEPRMEDCASGGAMEVENVDRMCGLVYRRKRKRKRAELTNRLAEDERYGKTFVRRKWRTRCRASESYGTRGDFRDSVTSRELAIVANGSPYDCGYWIICFLTSVLSYMTRVRIEVRQLSAFLLSKPIFDAYSSRGVLFLQDPVTAKNPGVCIIFGSRSLVPFFSVNIFAVPSFFMHMQTSIFLSSAHLICLLVAHYDKGEKVIDRADDSQEPSDSVSEASQISPGRDVSYFDVVATDNDTSGKLHLSHSAVGLPKPALRNLQLRNSRNIQKRRSSLRRKRGRPPSAFRDQKANGALASDRFRIRHDGAQKSGGAPSHLLRSSDRRRSTNIKELKSALGPVAQSMCASSCSANLLVTDTDKCYRVEGATITLELSASKQCFLAVMEGGTKQCSLTAQKVMRPSSSNRYTHAIIWAGDGSWKFEFPNKQDWLIFKELYKECSDWNMQASAASLIPIPGVQQVSSPVDNDYIPYVRPDSYITVKDDELVRALVKKSPNYDMDSDDEEWLVKVNNGLYAGREMQELVTPESFELVIDALERGFHCNPDEHLDEQAAYDICMHLERRAVIVAIHKYWIRKRKQKQKQKHSALVRIFQKLQSNLLLSALST